MAVAQAGDQQVVERVAVQVREDVNQVLVAKVGLLKFTNLSDALTVKSYRFCLREASRSSCPLHGSLVRWAIFLRYMR